MLGCMTVSKQNPLVTDDLFVGQSSVNVSVFRANGQQEIVQ